MKKIKITCDGCHTSHEVDRTPEIPDDVISLGCNFCPKCEDKATDYYEEWYNYNDGVESQKDDNIPDNQLVMPFIFEELEFVELKTVEHEPNNNRD